MFQIRFSCIWVDVDVFRVIVDCIFVVVQLLIYKIMVFIGFGMMFVFVDSLVEGFYGFFFLAFFLNQFLAFEESLYCCFVVVGFDEVVFDYFFFIDYLCVEIVGNSIVCYKFQNVDCVVLFFGSCGWCDMLGYVEGLRCFIEDFFVIK